jgi:alpha-galactosidase
MQHPKVVVIGAGSLFFGRQVLWNMLHSEILRRGTLAYVDIDGSRLDRMVKLAQLMVEHLESPLRVEGSTDRRKVLGGADFVVLSFARDGVKYRRLDCEISAKHGVLMCSGDTVGPGGIFRAARELPEILRVAADVKTLCGDAWVINYINPTTVNGIGLMRHAPDVRSFAMCDSLHMPYAKHDFLVRAGVAPGRESITAEMEKDFELRIAGVNHFPWLLSATYRGKNVTPRIRKGIEEAAAGEKDEGYSKARFNNSYTLELWDIFGFCPVNISHTKEYVPYWQGRGVSKGKLPPLTVFDATERQKLHDAMWEEVEGYISHRIPASQFMGSHAPDHATDVIESMWGGLGKRFFVSSPNRAAVSNMDDDAFLELLSDIDMHGVRPLPVGSFPPGIRALEQRVLETHELSVEAIVQCDRKLLRRAMMLDPIVNSIADGDRIIEELLEAEKAALPECWFK